MSALTDSDNPKERERSDPFAKDWGEFSGPLVDGERASLVLGDREDRCYTGVEFNGAKVR